MAAAEGICVGLPTALPVAHWSSCPLGTDAPADPAHQGLAFLLHINNSFTATSEGVADIQGAQSAALTDPNFTAK